MAKTVAALVGGVLLGVAGTWIVVAPTSGSGPVSEPVRDIDVVATMTPEAAEEHRAARFADLTTITQIYALPDSFTRSEALYTVAGRSSAAAVQDLIFEANRIADDYEREQALNGLFFRLTSLDPRSALALAQSEYFENVRSVEQTVWRAWGRTDLDEALFAARTQTSRAKQNMAAQALYAAYGLFGNEHTERIESELGIGPNRSTRARYLYRLADKSIEEAIAFINGLDSVGAQHENISWLAYYLSLQDTAMAITYAEYFEDRVNEERYRNIVQSNVARENPRLTIDRILASGEDVSRSSEFFSAVRQLVRTDMDAAMAYFENYSNQQYRQWFGNIIVQQLVVDDPMAALAWAREADSSSSYSRLEMNVLNSIARSDPQLALNEIQKIEHAERRSNAYAGLISELGNVDPEEALAYVDQIPDARTQRMAIVQLSQNWITRDPEAAISWILTQDDALSSEIIASAGSQLVHTNIDAAMRLLPRLSDHNQQTWRMQITQQLASTRTLQDAQTFVQQFEGQPGFDQLQASLVSGVLRKDPVEAKMLADQLSDARARDSAYMQIVSQQADTDPTQAVAWLGNISDDNLRAAAVGQIASTWSARDPQAAQNWVATLPHGAARDDAIMHMSYRWSEPTQEQTDLINSIGDPDKRGQAKIRRIYEVMQTDPIRAQQMLRDEDIPEELRQQVEVALSQWGRRW